MYGSSLLQGKGERKGGQKEEVRGEERENQIGRTGRRRERERNGEERGSKKKGEGKMEGGRKRRGETPCSTFKLH